ncbi:MAG: YihY/virulence factor BrkB family protein [Steroidobacteraceae bacterium]|jgi:membrane protein|nr:YihY/virulence factor BrkB family protein [Steroidobacteraceae bacterium]
MTVGGPAPRAARWRRPLQRLEARLRPGGWELLKRTFERWSAHEAPRLGAALAFYSMLSLAPLMVLVVAIVGLAFGETAAATQVAGQVRDMVGEEGAEAIQALVWNARTSSASTLASAIGIATLLFGASSVFAELRAILNLVWEAERPQGLGFVTLLRHRFFSFGMVLGVGFLLIVSLTISAALAAASKYFSQWLPVPAEALDALNFIVSFAVTTGAFALIYKYVPVVRIAWNDVWIGAFATALLFTVGKTLIGLYLGRASFGSAYGAAGSLIVVIVWVYYSAQIFIFGAEFTHVYAHTRGSRCPQGAAPA